MSIYKDDIIRIFNNMDAQTGKTFKNSDPKELHHGAIHKTNANRSRYPNFLKSALCLYLLGTKRNDTHNPSFGRMPDEICEEYEKMLSAIKKIRNSEYCRESKLMIAVIHDILDGGDGDVK